jgi:hypothetical protein
MEKKQFLIPQILGILLAVSVITACEELDVFEITIIDLSDVKPVDGVTLENSFNKGAYTVTLIWYIYESLDEYKINGKSTELKNGSFVNTGYYKVDFTLEAKDGCKFSDPRIIFENFRELYINKDSNPNKDKENKEKTITGYVIFSPLVFE